MKKTSKIAARNQIGPRVQQTHLRCSPAASEEDLAGRLAAQGIDIDRSAISRIENRTRYLMDYAISAIAPSLSVTVGRLFGETEDRR